MAGDARRKSIDFGYWYVPEGRSAAEQAKFQSVEARPQALEWLFSLACNCHFQLSLDNHLDLGIRDKDKFACSVAQEAKTFILKGLPNRAKSFFMELARSFDTALVPSEIHIETSLLYENRNSLAIRRRFTCSEHGLACQTIGGMRMDDL